MLDMATCTVRMNFRPREPMSGHECEFFYCLGASPFDPTVFSDNEQATQAAQDEVRRFGSAPFYDCRLLKVWDSRGRLQPPIHGETGTWVPDETWVPDIDQSELVAVTYAGYKILEPDVAQG
jgi:hypothetical protein